MFSVPTLLFAAGCALVVISIFGGGIEIKDFRVPPLKLPARLLAAGFGLLLAALPIFAPAMVAEIMGTAPAPPPTKPPPSSAPAAQQSAAASEAPVSSSAAASASAASSDAAASSHPASSDDQDDSDSDQPSPTPKRKASEPNQPDQEAKKYEEYILFDNIGDGEIYEHVTIVMNGNLKISLNVDRQTPQDKITLRSRAGDMERYSVNGSVFLQGEDASSPRTFACQGAVEAASAVYELNWTRNGSCAFTQRR